MSRKEPDRPKQKTLHGHEIPVPTRLDFLRDLKKIAKPKPRKSRSRPRRPPK